MLASDWLQYLIFPMNVEINELIAQTFQESIQTKQAALDGLRAPIRRAIELLVSGVRESRTVLTCGNGGSACDSLHFAAELVNRYRLDRRALPAVALTADMATLTAIGNDDCYDHVFSRQIEALGRPDDILLAITTSGNSKNVLAAVEAAHRLGLRVIGLTGRDGGRLGNMLSEKDCLICVPSEVTARIQETHLLILHCLCDAIDKILFQES